MVTSILRLLVKFNLLHKDYLLLRILSFFLKKNNILLTSLPQNRLLLIGEKENFGIKKLVLRKRDSDIQLFTNIFRDQEYNMVGHIATLFDINVSTVIDGGANIGLSAIYFKSLFPSAKIISIEPFQKNFNLLKENIAFNNLNDIVPIECGIWYKNCHLAIDENSANQSSWAVRTREDSVKSSSNIKGLTIISIAEKFNFDHIDLLKLDIEGAEKYLFSSKSTANEFLSKTKILCLEVHQEDIRLEKVTETLHELNFTFIIRKNVIFAVNRTLTKQ